MAAVTPTIGWIGTGRMGYQLALRLLHAGYDVAVYNRTRAKAEPLTEHGAKVVDSPADLAGRDVVFIMVAADKDLEAVVSGPRGVLTGDAKPGIVVDSSTVSTEASARVRARAEADGVQFLAAPVSGNPKVIGPASSPSPPRDRARRSMRSSRCSRPGDAASRTLARARAPGW